MSIASAIQLKQQQVEEAYTAVSNKGGTIPSVRNLTNLADAIDSITGGSGTLITKEITENGVYRASTYGADGFSSISVDVSGAVLITTTVTENGTYYAVVEGADGFSEFTVDTPAQTLINKTITANGTYYAGDDEAYGFSMVDVEVPGQPLLVNKTITANGTYTASTDDDAYGYDTVIVNTPYQGYLDDITQVLTDAGITVTGDYGDLADTIRNSFNTIAEQLQELNNESGE